MKRRIISVVLVVAIVLGYIGLSRILSDGKKVDYGFSKKDMVFSEGADEITETVISSGQYTLKENANYKLEISGKSDIQIVSKTTDKVWKAVPDNNFGNSKYSSSLVLTYFVDEKTQKTVYSSQDAVEKNQYKIFKTKNGARVEYIFGEMSSIYIYPDIISKERLDGFLEKVDPDDSEYILRRYQLYVLDEYEKKEKDYLLSLYPRLKDEDIYVLNDISTPYMKKKVNDIFISAGYTEKDKNMDNGNFEGESKKPQSFKISVEYQLTDKGFKALLDLDNCAFYNEYPIASIQILPYFDAYGKGEEGYFVIPSGSGALTYINSTKKKEEKIEIPVYGKNLSIYPQNDIVDNNCSFPMFGAYKDNSAYICSFNNCGEQTSIDAETGSLLSAIHPTYSIIDSQVSSLKSEAIIWFSAGALSTDVIEANYHLIDKAEYATAYSEMANIYRDMLISQGLLVKNDISGNIPMIANIVNTVNYDTMNLGCFPANKEFALTTFDESYKISEELSNLTGASDLKVLLSGWNYKGVGAQKFKKVTFSKIAGGQKGLEKLQKSLSQKGIESFLDMEFNFVKPKSNNGFNSGSQAVRDINNAVVNVEEFDPKLNAFKKTSKQLVSSLQFNKVFDRLENNELFQNSGIGVNQFTQLLYGDYANGEVCGRGKTMSIVSDNLQKLSKNKIAVIGAGANIYALKYLKILSSVPLYSNNDNFFDKDIPFVQMVLHGYIDYTSTAINDLTASEDTLLKLVETGSGLNYRLTMNTFSDIFETDCSYLYNTEFENNKQSIGKYYEKISKILADLNDQRMVSHKYLTDTVVKVSYENGDSVIINYGNKSYKYKGKLCKAKDCLRIKKENK